MAEGGLRDALRVIRAGFLMGLIPIAVWWLVIGADWVTKRYVCGPMPALGALDPAFNAWWGCVGWSMMLMVMVPIAFAGGAALKTLDVRYDRRRRALEDAGGG